MGNIPSVGLHLTFRGVAIFGYVHIVSIHGSVTILLRSRGYFRAGAARVAILGFEGIVLCHRSEYPRDVLLPLGKYYCIDS